MSSVGYRRSIASASTFRLRRLGGNPLTSGLGRGDDLDASRRYSLENAIFGVLFTLSKENSEVRIVLRWAVLKTLLDFWQVFTTVINPNQGWNINEKGTIWRIVSVLSFGWLENLGYGAFVALLYGMVGMLAVNIGLCVWVAWCFKEQKFPVVWPIKVLRLFTSVFFQAFDVASLNLLQLGMNCNLTGPETPHLYLSTFPDYSCSTMPHVVHAIVSGVSLLVFVILALLTNMAEVEVNPKGRRPMALGHSGAEVTTFAIKALMTLVDVFFGWRKVAACIYLGLSLLMAWQYLRWSPNLVNWVNHLKTGLSFSIVWCVTVLIFLVFRPGVKPDDVPEFSRWMTIAMLSGIAPAICGGALTSWLLIRRSAALAKAALRQATEKNVPLQDMVVDLWTDPRDVELAARCCRVWVDRNVLNKDAVARAQTYIKAGLALFPGNAFVSLVQANFMIDVLGVAQSGSRQIEAARKLQPSIMCRFMIFVRMQQAQQAATATNVGGPVGNNMDLLGYVEYQRKQRMVVRLHREALTAMCNFWKALDSHTISFTYLSKALANIEASVSRAQNAYHLVLETYSNNYRLVRLYAKFLETVKNDPWGALEYYNEADRLEQEKNDDGGGPLLPDGTPLSRMDELSTAVVVVSSVGEIQMANKQVHHLFGYKKGDLDGKAITSLLAPQSGKRMGACLARLVEQSMLSLGQGGPDGLFDNPTSSTTAVLGVHHDRMAFPLRVSITKASGVGEDSTFIALLEPVHVAKDVAYFWVAPNGVIAGCDPQFVANYGFMPQDVVGAHLGDFLVVDGDLTSLRGAEASASAAAHAAAVDRWDVEADAIDMTLSQPVGDSVNILHSIEARTASGIDAPCHVSHRYSSPIACAASARQLDLGDALLYEIKICRASPEPFLMLVADRKGGLKFSSPQMTTLLCPRASNAPGALLTDSDAFKDRADGGHKGVVAHHGLAILSGVGAAHGLIAGYNLNDFLPHPWKDIHVKLLKDTSSPAATNGRSYGSCTRAQGKGPSMEMQDTHGSRLYMHVAVSTTELVGEQLHIIRMAPSSLETAISERRLRITVSSNGLISAVSKDTPSQQLFGFDASQMLGRPLWEVVDGVEQQLLMRPGSSLERVNGQGQGSEEAFMTILERAIRMPSRSYRVSVLPPIPHSATGSRSNIELAAAQRAAQVRPAVMQIHIPVLEMDDNDAAGGSGGVPPGDGVRNSSADGEEHASTTTIYVDLWTVQSLSGVLELNALGRITSVLEEHSRPVGLLFGVATKSLVGQTLLALVSLPLGRDEVGDLLSAGSRSKKSSLKSTQKDAAVKVGPVHLLDAVHVDGQPLKLAVQVIGKPGPGQALTVLLRPHMVPMSPTSVEQLPGNTALVLPTGPAKLSATGYGGTGIGVRTSASGYRMKGGGRGIGSAMKGDASGYRMGAGSGAAFRIGLGVATPAVAAGADGSGSEQDGEEDEDGDDGKATIVHDSDTPSLREMENFVANKSSFSYKEKLGDMVAKLEKVGKPGRRASLERISFAVKDPGPTTALERNSTGARLSSAAIAAVAAAAESGDELSTRARPATPSTPVKTPAELPAPLGVGSGSHSNEQPSAVTPPSRPLSQPRSGTVATLPATAPPKPPALGLQMDLPLPGIVMGSGSLTGPAGRKDQLQLQLQPPQPAAQESSAGKGPRARVALVSDSPRSIPAPSPVIGDSDMEGSAGESKKSDSKDGEAPPPDDDDGVRALNPKGMQRISDWVHSKGAIFHNSKPLKASTMDTMEETINTAEDDDTNADAEDVLAAGGKGERWPAAARGGRVAAAMGLQPRTGATAGEGWSAGGGGLESAALRSGGTLSGGGGIGGVVGVLGGPGPGVLSGLPPGLAPRLQGSGDLDDRSGDGQSVVSGGSASSGGEYKRGKRFRNLVKLMDSSEAEQVMRRFRVGALVTMGILAIAHTVCFALIVVSIGRQQAAMQQLFTAGRAQRMLHQTLTYVRSLDQIYYKTTTPANLYSRSDIKSFAENILSYASSVKMLNNDVAKANWDQASVRNLYFYESVQAWYSHNETTKQDLFRNITLWDMATNVYVCSKDIYQNHVNWSNANIRIASTPSGHFLLKSGPDLFNGFRMILDALLYIAMDNTDIVNNLLLAFLVLEGCGVSVMAAAVLAYLLRKLALQRYTLYGTFLAIPVGLTRALTTQLANTTLLEEDDDEESQDGDGNDDDGDKGQDNDGGNGGGNGGGGHGAVGGRDGAGNGSMKRRHATVEAPSASQAPRPRPSFTETVLAASKMMGVGPGAAGAVTSGLASTASAPRPPNPSLLASSPPAGSSSQHWRSHTWHGRLLMRLYSCMPCLARRSQAVFPSPTPGLGGDIAGMHVHHRRNLRLDSSDTTRLLLPFVVWSVLVVTFYAVSVVELKQSSPLVAIASVCNFNIARTYRSVFFAQELAAEEDPTMLASRRATLRKVASMLRDAFYTLQLGSDAYKTLGPDTEQFPLVTSGLSYETEELQRIFYSNTGCLRDPSTSCEGPSYRYYQLTHAGVDSVMQVFLDKVFAMSESVVDVTPGLDNINLDFIYNVGTKDLTDANIRIGELHFGYIGRMFRSIRLLHILLFVLLWFFLAGFHFLLLKPLLVRLGREKRHIAELMSQLPLELDVEKLVRTALASSNGVGSGSGAHTAGDAAAASAAATQAQVVTDAARAWKNVLRSTTNLIKDANQAQKGMRERRASMMSNQSMRAPGMGMGM